MLAAIPYNSVRIRVKRFGKYFKFKNYILVDLVITRQFLTNLIVPYPGLVRNSELRFRELRRVFLVR